MYKYVMSNIFMVSEGAELLMVVFYQNSFSVFFGLQCVAYFAAAKVLSELPDNEKDNLTF